MNVETFVSQTGAGLAPIAQQPDTITPKLDKDTTGIGGALDSNWKQPIAPLCKTEMLPDDETLNQSIGSRLSNSIGSGDVALSHAKKLLSKTEANFSVGDLKDDSLTRKGGAGGLGKKRQHAMKASTAALTSTSPIRVQAESLSLSGYRVESNSTASGGKVISLVGGKANETGKATATFKGAAGKYNVVLGYYDENDGEAQVQTSVNGKVTATTLFNQNLGNGGIGSKNLVKRTVASNVSLTDGSKIELLGKENRSEHARVDYIEFVPVAGSGTPSTPPPPPAPPGVDGIKPTATLKASAITTAGAANQTFTVTYADNVAINAATLDSNDIRVTGPNGFSQAATLVGVDNSSNGSPRTATYRINAPGGSWDAADNGSYTVSVLNNQVSDTSGNSIVGGSLGIFQANIATSTPPSTGGGGVQPQGTVIFSDSFDNGISSTWKQEAVADYSIQSATAPGGEGKVTRFELRRDDPMKNLGKRAEMHLGGMPAVLGQEYWYSTKMMLPSDWEPDSTGFDLVTQFHDIPDRDLGEGWKSPPLGLQIQNGQYSIFIRTDPRAYTPNDDQPDKQTLWKSPIETGKWVDWKYRVKWSYKSDGILQVWKDGKLVVDHRGPNTYNDEKGPYFKIGVYKVDWKWADKLAISKVNKRVLYFDKTEIRKV